MIEWSHHAFFTGSPLPLVQADVAHRKHAIIEQVIADLNGPMAHLPSGRMTANAAWLVLAAIAFTPTRAAGCLARHEVGEPARLRHHRHPVRSPH